MNNKKLIDSLLKYPIYFYMLYFIFSIRPDLDLIKPVYGNYASYIHFIFLGWGGCIILYNIFFNKKYLKNISIKITLLFSLFVLLTIGYNIQMITINSLKASVLTIFSMLIMLTSYGTLREKYSDSTIFKTIFYPTFILKFILTIISILLYYFNVSVFILGKEELGFLGIRYVEVVNGKYTPLLYGVYKDPNYSSIYSLSVIIIAAYLLINKAIIKSKLEKILLYLFMVIEFIFITYCNSRGMQLAVYTVIVLYILLLCVKRIRKLVSTKKILVTIVGFCLLLICWSGSQRIGFRISQFSELHKYAIVHTGNTASFSKFENVDLSKSSKIVQDTLKKRDFSQKDLKNNVIEEKEDSTESVGNGRIAIWEDALKLYTKSPVLGFGPNMQEKNAEKYIDLDIPTMMKGRSLHNSYLNLMFSFGIFPLFIVVASLACLYYKMLRIELKNKENENTVVFLGITALFITYMFLEAVFININYQQVYTLFIVSFLMVKYQIVESEREQ